MKRYLLFLVVALLAIGCFTACSSDDNEGEESVTHLLPKGKIDLNKLPAVTSDEFFSKVTDHGWRHLGTYEILSDGSLSSTDYYKGAIGYGPSDFYFSKDKITKFFYNDALGKLNKSTVQTMLLTLGRTPILSIGCTLAQIQSCFWCSTWGRLTSITVSFVITMA